MAAQSKLSLQSTNRTFKLFLTEFSTLYFRHRTKISRTIYFTLFLTLLNRIHAAVAEQKEAALSQLSIQRRTITNGNNEPNKRPKVELNREFFRNLFRLLKICIPGWRSKEMRLLINHTVLLIIRTLISLKVAAMDGALVSSLVRGKGRDFVLGLIWWMLIAIPATITNSMASKTLIYITGKNAEFHSFRTTSANSHYSIGHD